jgi:hypothetical protein
LVAQSAVASRDVRFTPESDRLLRCREMTQRANRRQSALQQKLFDHLAGRGQAEPEG